MSPFAGARRSRRVHPRVGGETLPSGLGIGNAACIMGPSPRGRGNRLRYRAEHEGRRGPSPRGRGNHVDGSVVSTLERSIPAWAGKPFVSSCVLSYHRVHPRVGGETRITCFSGVGSNAMRVHPRVGGETWATGATASSSTLGPSPRGRGNPVATIVNGREMKKRSIPAWAGKPDAE